MQTQGWMSPFLTALGQTGNVAEACRRAQISRSCVYKRQARCPAFAAQCAVVMDQVRANGWRKLFLDTLRTTGRVRVSVAACGKPAFLVYYHRRRDPAFARAWTAALQAAPHGPRAGRLARQVIRRGPSTSLAPPRNAADDQGVHPSFCGTPQHRSPHSQTKS